MNDTASTATSDDLLQLASLRSAFSEPRLGRYLAAFDNDLRSAIECHHWNSRIGHALFLPVQIFEITLRNKLDLKLSETFGDEWLISWPDWLYDKENRINRQRTKIEKAIDYITRIQGKAATHSKIVAELSFSFWVHLLSRPYLENLWVPYLRHCFSASNGSQKQVHEQAERLLILRNRISHHEPILFEDGDIRLRAPEGVAVLLDQVLEAIGWMCPHTQAFAKERCSFSDLHRGFEEYFETVSESYNRGVRSYSWRRPERLRIVVGRLGSFNMQNGFGYMIVQNHQDILIETEAINHSGINEIRIGQTLEATFEYVGRTPVARSLRLL